MCGAADFGVHNSAKESAMASVAQATTDPLMKAAKKAGRLSG